MSSLVRYGCLALARKFDFNLPVCIRRAPDGDLHSSLQDSVITEDRGD